MRLRKITTIRDKAGFASLRLLVNCSASGPRLRGFGMGRVEKAAQPRQVALRSPPIFMVSGRCSWRHERLLGKSTTKKRTRVGFSGFFVSFVTSWLILIVPPRLSLRHDLCLTYSITQNYGQNIRNQNDYAKCKNITRICAGFTNRFFRRDRLLR